MEFYYSGSIEALKTFYLSMRKINVQIGTFEYTYNGIISDVIFDTRDSELWKLVFIKRGHGDILSIPIKKGYRFTIEGNEKYKEFADYEPVLLAGKSVYLFKKLKRGVKIC